MKVDLWLAKLDELTNVDESLLSEEEQFRADRFIHQNFKNHFIKRRSILRQLLARYLAIKPNEIVINQTKLGKPYVANADKKIFFNTSHSKGHVLYGFSKDAELGVDIEFLDAEIEAELISNHFFGSDEISLIRSSVGKTKSEAFFRLWCIKEAYIKLVGKGLTFPLDQVLVTNTMNRPFLIVPSHPDSNGPEVLKCRFLEVVPNFGIGVVVHGKELEIQYREYTFEC
ncbi:4'-phosphopantetheinyl transferase family protein [Algoriphagus yeomjeoni]|uniref:4'-phosphopantetheinyl transferase family protein n=1 Tax=Algoriphagus yeomjeoni TaxID=291403 RepID=UPI003CE4E3AA